MLMINIIKLQKSALHTQKDIYLLFIYNKFLNNKLNFIYFIYF